MLQRFLFIVGVLLCQAAFGRDVVDGEERHGLLGRRCISGQLAIQKPYEQHKSFYDFDATAEATLNIPIQWTEDTFATISQDVFFSICEFNPFHNEEDVVQLVGYNT